MKKKSPLAKEAKSVGLPEAYHREKMHDTDYQQRVKALAKYKKSGEKGLHPMVKEHMKSQKLTKKSARMGR